MKCTRNYLLTFISFLMPLLLSAQGIVNNGASIVVTQGAEVVIGGNNGGFTNQADNSMDGQVYLDGRINLQGNWLNNAGGTVFADPDETGLVIFGSDPDKAVQELGGSGVTRFENFTVNSDASAWIVAGAEIRVINDFILNGTLDIYGDLYIEGTFTNNGEITGTGTVYYQGNSPQVVASGSYPSLVLDNPEGFTLANEVYVNTKLTLSQGAIALGEHNLVLGPDCELLQNKTPSTWVDATSTGMLIKRFDQAGTFEFPVGNFGTDPVYSPVIIQIVSATFDEAQVSVRLKPFAHPHNNTGGNSPNYLKRYWEVESEGMPDAVYNIYFYYAETDVFGDEAKIEGAKFIETENLWEHFSHVHTNEHFFEAHEQDSFSAFTGVQENRNPELEITYPPDGASIYETNISVTGTASDIDGDLWEVFLRVNDGSWQPVTGKENWSFPQTLSFGNWKFQAKAVDYQNAESVVDEHTVYAGIQSIAIPQGWSMISSYLDPLDPNLENIMLELVNANLLTIMINQQGNIYWPSQNINNINQWYSLEAYKLQATESSEMLFGGDKLTDTELELIAGYNYLPVLTNVPTPIAEAFANPLEDVKLIFNPQTVEIYWPDGGIFSLQELQPGLGYLAFMNSPATATFPGYDMNPGKTYGFNVEPPDNGPWPLVRTNKVHLISLQAVAIEELENHTYVAAFNSADQCNGFADISQKSENVLLAVYGDDPYTPDPDGAQEGEFIIFKAYDPATGLETELEAEYSKSFPNYNGRFVGNGLSGVVDFKEGQTHIGGSSSPIGISLYPNPVSKELNLIFENTVPDENTRIELVNTDGAVVLENDIMQKHTKISVQHLQPGIYVLKIIHKGNYNFRKVVVR